MGLELQFFMKFQLTFFEISRKISECLYGTVNARRKPERGINKESSNFRRKPERGTKKGSKIAPPPPMSAGVSRMKGGCMNDRNIKPGYVYHIKDLYFESVKDDKLMRNKEGGAYRPTYYCLKDEKTGLLWFVPMSGRVDKYSSIIEKDTARYGSCLKILVARYGDGQSVFLFQNMFPILPKYIDHIHTVSGIPMAVNHAVKGEIIKRFKEIRRLYSRGVKMVFPDITRLEKLMIEELTTETDK